MCPFLTKIRGGRTGPPQLLKKIKKGGRGFALLSGVINYLLKVNVLNLSIFFSFYINLKLL